MTIWESMGFMRWPLAFAGLWIVGLSLYGTMRVFRGNAIADLRTKAWIDAILFWGAFAAISGVLGTLIGIIIAAQSIEAAGAVSTSIVWGGIKVAMLTSAFGVLMLAGAALVWFPLQMRWRILHASENED